MITLMLIPLRNCQNLEVDRVRVLCIHSGVTVHTLGDTSAFVNPAGQLLLIAINSGLIAEWMASA